MTKSTCIIFILGFSLVFGLEKRRCSLVFIVLLIALGLFMFTYQSTQFNTEGFFLVLSASFLAGLRWTLAQLVMQRKEVGLGNPIDMIFHVQPWMILGLLPLAIAFEGIPIATSEKVFRFHEVEMLVRTGQYVLAGSVLAFFMELSEYLLLTLHVESLTLSIAGRRQGGVHALPRRQLQRGRNKFHELCRPCHLSPGHRSACACQVAQQQR
uniref:Putative solute carrier family 35 member c2 n=1 Tax=Ixodes ricinus TaxID=34613 RepID=V5H4X4_IXORI